MQEKKESMKSTPTRKESDSLGQVHIAKEAYWGSQTERSLANFKIGHEKFPEELIVALALIKKACAIVNAKLGLLSKKKKEACVKACDEIVQGALLDQFPLSIWQTGSGTQTNMNVNEVIANRANELCGYPKGSKTALHPNDDVNMSQSSNDVFPSALHIACVLKIQKSLLPALDRLYKSMKAKSQAFHTIVKVGRTHLMDAAPLTLGQEFSGYAHQLYSSMLSIKESLKELKELPLGATAVGTGLNAPKGFSKLVTKEISRRTKTAFIPAKNPFAAIASSDPCVTFSSALKRLAVALYKIANDIRWMASGPRCGLQELILPVNEPGSSIMPGKVNPTQCEALMMVCMQVMGHDVTITQAACSGNFELNVARPVIAYNLLQSIHLLKDAMESFDQNCIRGLKANKKRLQEYVENSLMHATALTPKLGYDQVAKVVQKAQRENKSLKSACLELDLLSEEEFDAIVAPSKMV